MPPIEPLSFSFILRAAAPLPVLLIVMVLATVGRCEARVQPATPPPEVTLAK